MRRLETLVTLVTLATLLISTWPRAPRDLATPLMQWHPPPRPTPWCGADVLPVAILADPDRMADNEGETLWLRNVEPAAIELVGWTLERGRTRRPLDDVTLAPGERLALVGRDLRPLRLPNRGGQVVLRDPCGGLEVLTWGPAEPGRVAACEDEDPGP